MSVPASTTLRVERAREGDIDGIMRVEEASFAPGIREGRSVFIDRIRAFPEGNLVLREPVSEGDAVRGYFSSEIWDSVPTRADDWALGHLAQGRHCTDGRVLYVSSFAIAPSPHSVKGSGLGHVFFNAALERILDGRENLEKIVLIVNEDWLAARHIYETGNFRYTGMLKGFFRPDACRVDAKNPPQDALIMERTL